MADGRIVSGDYGDKGKRERTCIDRVVMIVEDDWDVELWADFEEVVHIVAYLDDRGEFGYLEWGQSIYLIVYQNQSPLYSITKLLLIVIFEACESGSLVAIHPLM